MNCLSLTDWSHMNNEHNKRIAWIKEYHATPVKKRAALEKIKTDVPRLNKVELIELDVAIATLSKPTKDGELYSPSLTLATIKDQRLKDYLTYVALEYSRSNLFMNSAKDHTRHSPLTPIFLAAHKQYNGIAYEEWDKSDKYMNFCVGNKLHENIIKWKDTPLSPELHKIARMNALRNTKGKEVAATAYPRHIIKLDSSTKLDCAEPFRHMWLQTWIANVELRDEYMILDYNNWDLMPEALDAVFKPEPVAEVQVAKIEEEELPW